MARFWPIVNRVIHEADVILLVLDARLVAKTRHVEIENKVATAGKRIIYVINKCDLIENTKLEAMAKQLRPSVFVSATTHHGVTKLRSAILAVGKPIAAGRDVIVGVLGFPNVGKSSIINMLRGKGSASVSSTAGHTKGIQKVRASTGIMMLDTPGVIPYNEGSKEGADSNLAIIGSKNVQQLKDPEKIAAIIILDLEGKVEEHYGVVREAGEDEEDIIEKIALKRGRLLKMGIPDTKTMAKTIIMDWQKGKMKK